MAAEGANGVGRRGLLGPGKELPGVVAEEGPAALLGVLDAEDDGAAVHESAIDRVGLFKATRLVLERGMVGWESGRAGAGGLVRINEKVAMGRVLRLLGACWLLENIKDVVAFSLGAGDAVIKDGPGASAVLRPLMDVGWSAVDIPDGQ